MRAKNIGAARKIGDGPHHAQDAVHRSCRELQQIDRVFQHRLIFGGEPADRIRTRLIEMRVAAAGALQLNLGGADDAGADLGAGLVGRRIGP